MRNGKYLVLDKVYNEQAIDWYCVFAGENQLAKA